MTDKEIAPFGAFVVLDENAKIRDISSQAVGMTPKGIAILIKELKKNMYTVEDTEEQHLTSNIFFTAYSHMLDTNKSAKECIIHAATIHKKDVEKVLAEKSKGSGRLSKKVIKKHDHHPIQKDMIKQKTFNRQALSNAKNLWQLLNTLSTFRQMYAWLLELRKDNKSLNTRMHLAEAEIARLNSIVGLGEMSFLDKLKYLKGTGLTQQECAEILSKSLSTIKRNWNIVDDTFLTP